MGKVAAMQRGIDVTQTIRHIQPELDRSLHFCNNYYYLIKAWWLSKTTCQSLKIQYPMGRVGCSDTVTQ